MTLDILQEMLGWCSIINMGLLLFWFSFFVYGHDFVYNLHTRWFKLSVESFDKIHYSGMALFKLFIYFFNVIPYFVLLAIS